MWSQTIAPAVVLVLLQLSTVTRVWCDSSSSDVWTPFDGSAHFPVRPLLDDEGRPLWSTLAPGHYFGLRAEVPDSPTVSMMWFTGTKSDRLHHWCEHDDVDRFFWNYHDLRSFGHQSIRDGALLVNTSFVRLNATGGHRLLARVSLHDPSPDNLHSVILYTATESAEDHIVPLDVDKLKQGTVQECRVQTRSPATRLGDYTLHFRVVSGNPVTRALLNTNSTIDRLRETVHHYLDTTTEHNGHRHPIFHWDVSAAARPGNLVAYQLVFTGSLEVEIEMEPNAAAALAPGFRYETELAHRMADFDSKFERRFGLRERNVSVEVAEFARSVLSNTIGGVGYFYGTASVDDPRNVTAGARPYGPAQLFSAVPSRTKFPRGFLWDEGFHQLIVGAWDPTLAADILDSWFGLMNHEGWIQREVVLGTEAGARIPSNYRTQHATSANPPSLLLAVESLIDAGHAPDAWLRRLHPRLARWFQWFNHTQAGTEPWTYRWRGRPETPNVAAELNPRTLESGLDDYPRASHPTDEESHLDLRCWMALAARLMAKISHTLGVDKSDYEHAFDRLSDPTLLDHLYWSAEHGQYCERGLNTDDMALEKVTHADGRTELRPQAYSLPRFGLVCRLGLVSLFPVMMRLLPANSTHLGPILAAIEDPARMWSDYGLRSVARSDRFYDRFNTATNGPYWRGTVWINLNWMTLGGLKHYASVDGPWRTQAHRIYDRLRANLITNMVAQYRRTGFVWEHYSDKDGAGGGTFPFTGWSALIIRIIGEQY